MSGFITIERRIWKHEVFVPSPMSEREAFMWMIGRAAWSGTQHRVGTELIDVERGSFFTTLREMQSLFMWNSDKKVRNFLKKLENHGILAVQTMGQRNARKTHVTICNYDEYQTAGRSTDAAKTHEGRTKDAVKKPSNQVTNIDTSVSIGDKPKKSPQKERGEIISILSKSASPEASASYVAYRAKIKKPLTVTAASRINNQLQKVMQAQFDPSDALGVCEERGWTGFKADWYFNSKGQENDSRTNNTTGRTQNKIGDAQYDEARQRALNSASRGPKQRTDFF